MKTKYCDVCGKSYATETHHTISGTSERRITDKHPEMLLDLCRTCHNDIHLNNTACMLSKMYGQAMYEKTHTREEYMKEFKKNYLP